MSCALPYFISTDLAKCSKGASPRGELFSVVGTVIHRGHHSKEWTGMNFSRLPTPGTPLLSTELLPSKTLLHFLGCLTVHRPTIPQTCCLAYLSLVGQYLFRMDPWAIEYQYLLALWLTSQCAYIPLGAGSYQSFSWLDT